MAESYVTIWSKEHCRKLERHGDRGPLAVIFGGPHIPMPSIAHVQPGDELFVLMVSQGVLYIVGQMKVKRIVQPETAVRKLIKGLPKGFTLVGSDERQALARMRPGSGHRFPHSCVASAALAEHGTVIRFDRAFPGEQLTLLRLGPRGRERPIKGISGTLLRNGSSFQGHVRRLNPESANLLRRVLEVGEP